MIFVNARSFAALLICLLAPMTASALECPYKLLWTNGTLWCYSTVTCESPRDCNKPSNIALIYDHVVSDTGCKSTATECKCKLPDPQNDYLFRVVLEGGGNADVYEMNPDLPIQNQNCSFLDAFNVPIQDSTDYFQCMEFRFTPDPAKPPQNLRIAIKLKSKPSQYLVNEDITVNATQLVRKVSGQEVKYQLLRSGMLMPEVLPAPKPDTPASAEQDDNTPPPVPDTAGGTDK